MINSVIRSNFRFRPNPLLDIQSPKRKEMNFCSHSEETKLSTLYRESLDKILFKDAKHEFLPQLLKAQSTIDQLVNEYPFFTNNDTTNDKKLFKKRIVFGKKFTRKTVMPFKPTVFTKNSSQLSIKHMNTPQLQYMHQISTSTTNKLSKKPKELGTCITSPMIHKITKKLQLKKQLSLLDLNTLNCDNKVSNNTEIQLKLLETDTPEILQEELFFTNKNSSLVLLNGKQDNEPITVKKLRRHKNIKELLTPNYILNQINNNNKRKMYSGDKVRGDASSTQTTKIEQEINSTNSKTQINQYNKLTKSNTMKVIKEGNTLANSNNIDEALNIASSYSVKYMLLNKKKSIKRPVADNTDNCYILDKELSSKNNSDFNKEIQEIIQRKKKKKLPRNNTVEKVINSSLKFKESLMMRLSTNNRNCYLDKKSSQRDFYYEVSPYFSKPKVTNVKMVQ